MAMQQPQKPSEKPKIVLCPKCKKPMKPIENGYWCAKDRIIQLNVTSTVACSHCKKPLQVTCSPTIQYPESKPVFTLAPQQIQVNLPKPQPINIQMPTKKKITKKIWLEGKGKDRRQVEEIFEESLQ